LMEPATLHRSPTFRNGKPRWLWQSSTISRSSPQSHIFGRPTGGKGRGRYPFDRTINGGLGGRVVLTRQNAYKPKHKDHTKIHCHTHLNRVAR